MTITTVGEAAQYEHRRFSGSKPWAVYALGKQQQTFHTRGDAELFARFFERRVPGSKLDVVWIGGEEECTEQP